MHPVVEGLNSVLQSTQDTTDGLFARASLLAVNYFNPETIIDVVASEQPISEVQPSVFEATWTEVKRKSVVSDAAASQGSGGGSRGIDSMSLGERRAKAMND